MSLKNMNHNHKFQRTPKRTRALLSSSHFGGRCGGHWKIKPNIFVSLNNLRIKIRRAPTRTRASSSSSRFGGRCGGHWGGGGGAAAEQLKAAGFRKRRCATHTHNVREPTEAQKQHQNLRFNLIFSWRSQKSRAFLKLRCYLNPLLTATLELFNKKE